MGPSSNTAAGRRQYKVGPVTPSPTMNTTPPPVLTLPARRRYGAILLLLLGTVLLPQSAHASFLQGETLDSVANGIAWVALIIAPIVGITVFLMVHVLPEKIAHKRNHPQLGAIKCLCLLSLVFGGLLWPIAWLWAYSKPVLHKMAYGTDVGDSHDSPTNGKEAAAGELEQLRARVAELEGQTGGGRAEWK